jgi:hypothetical protein
MKPGWELKPSWSYPPSSSRTYPLRWERIWLGGMIWSKRCWASSRSRMLLRISFSAWSFSSSALFADTQTMIALRANQLKLTTSMISTFSNSFSWMAQTSLCSWGEDIRTTMTSIMPQQKLNRSTAEWTQMWTPLPLLKSFSTRNKWILSMLLNLTRIMDNHNRTLPSNSHCEIEVLVMINMIIPLR